MIDIRFQFNTLCLRQGSPSFWVSQRRTAKDNWRRQRVKCLSERSWAARDLEDVPTPSLQNLLLDGWYLRQSPLNCAQKYLPDHQYPTLLQRAIYFGSPLPPAHVHQYHPVGRTRSCVFETIRATVGLPASPSTVFHIL